MCRSATAAVLWASVISAGVPIMAAAPTMAQSPQPGHTVIGDPVLPLRPIDSPAPVSPLSPSGPANLGPNPVPEQLAAPGSSTGSAGPLNSTPFSGGPTGGPAGGLSTDPSITGNHETSPGQAR